MHNQIKLESITVSSPFLDEVNVLAKEAFPPEEYLAPRKLVQMAEDDNFDFWALIDEESENPFVGFMVVQTYQELAYLFFLAISPECRSRGYGGRAIETLRAHYPDKKQVVDFEMLDETAANRHQREIRRKFYLRHGYKETGLFLSYLGVDYEVLSMDEDFDEEMFKAMMGTLRIDGFEPKYFRK